MPLYDTNMSEGCGGVSSFCARRTTNGNHNKAQRSDSGRWLAAPRCVPPKRVGHRWSDDTRSRHRFPIDSSAGESARCLTPICLVKQAARAGSMERKKRKASSKRPLKRPRSPVCRQQKLLILGSELRGEIKRTEQRPDFDIVVLWSESFNNRSTVC